MNKLKIILISILLTASVVSISVWQLTKPQVFKPETMLIQMGPMIVPMPLDSGFQFSVGLFAVKATIGEEEVFDFRIIEKVEFLQEKYGEEFYLVYDEKAVEKNANPFKVIAFDGNQLEVLRVDSLTPVAVFLTKKFKTPKKQSLPFKQAG